MQWGGGFVILYSLRVHLPHLHISDAKIYIIFYTTNFLANN